MNMTITSSPHLRSAYSTSSIMRDVIIALCPALIASIIIFGINSLIVVAVCVAACVLFEYLYCKLLNIPQTIGDLSAVITGILLAFNLPVTIPLWMAVIGCFAAVVIIKALFGGIGKNFANPAIVGRIVLFISFATPMTNWLVPVNSTTPDVITGATPLGILAEGGVDAVFPTYLEMFLGNIGGSLGETSALALIIGGIYLLMRKVITVTIPLAFIGTVFIFSFILGQDPIFHILAGGVMLGAIFMATDYTTSPTTESGKLIFGIGCGVLTVLIRVFGAYPEGVSFAILLMNIVCPHINNLTMTKAFGGAKTK